MKKNILLVDDERSLIEVVKFNLEKEGYWVEVATNGREAINLFHQKNPDLIILDLMLPEIDGIEVCKRIRKESELPIIMLTAKGEEMDRVLGLEIGADDYMVKPFSIRELLARIRVIFRRQKTEKEIEKEVIRYKDLKINKKQREVNIGDKIMKLSKLEFDLLFLLCSNPGLVFSRRELIKKLWSDEYYGEENIVDVHICKIRNKIGESPAYSECITTVRGVGYKFSPEKL